MRKLALSMALGLSMAVAAVFVPLSQKAHAASTPTTCQNLTGSKLTAVWWQWLFSVPASLSPVIDATGAHAYNGQPCSDLLFLAGTFTITQLANGDVLGEVTRTISVKQGTALFFPLINAELDNVCARPSLGGKTCFPGMKTRPTNLGVPKLQALAAALTDSASELFATLTPCSDAKCKKFTGPTMRVSSARLQSPPFNYELPAATDNLYPCPDICVSGTVSPAVADGYYSLVRGTLITPGFYQLQFGGQVKINDVPNFFIEKITYDITVTP
jgi:hypothetical protein